MAETTTITVRIPTELRDDLDRLGEITKRSRSFLAAAALEIYARYELEIVDGILQGIKDADEGRVYTTEQVKAEMDAKFERLKASSQRPRRAARG